MLCMQKYLYQFNVHHNIDQYEEQGYTWNKNDGFACLEVEVDYNHSDVFREISFRNLLRTLLIMKKKLSFLLLIWFSTGFGNSLSFL